MKKAGFPDDFVKTALLPDWWGPEADSDPLLVPEVEIAVARFLRLPVAEVMDPARTLLAPQVGGLLRSDKSRDKLAPAMFAAESIAGAVVRNLRDVPIYSPLPDDALDWRRALLRNADAVTLRTLVRGLWDHGIPVVRVSTLPSPKFRGMACIVDERPVVLLAWGGDDHPHFLIDAAHEAGHIARGHVQPDCPTVDESDDESDGMKDAVERSKERSAKEYCWMLLGGLSGVPAFSEVASGSPKTMKPDQFTSLALDTGRNRQIDAALVAHVWGLETKAFGLRKWALKTFEKATEASNLLDGFMKRHITLRSASETDSRLLGCLAGFS